MPLYTLNTNPHVTMGGYSTQPGNYPEGKYVVVQGGGDSIYRLTGWAIVGLDGPGIETIVNTDWYEFYMPNNDITITPVVEIITYSITYNGVDGDIGNPTTYTGETPTFTLINPSKSDYEFRGRLGFNRDTGIEDERISRSVTVPTGTTGDLEFSAYYEYCPSGGGAGGIIINGHNLEKRIIEGHEVVKVMCDGNQIWPSSGPTPPVPGNDYLYFTPATINGCEVSFYQCSIALEVSYDKNSWFDYRVNGSGDGEAISLNYGEKIYFRHIGVYQSGESSIGHFAVTGETKSGGDVGYLLCRGSTRKINGASLEYLFQGCTGLTTAPQLPATTLADNCYHGMFSGCTGLTTAPQLPATTLTEYCYESMFENCTSLTTPPQLPATTLANSCYLSMFEGCTGLTTAPQLPATTLTYGCYGYMFSGCTGLTTAPQLPATTLAGLCYNRMFSGCTGLTTTPQLPATTLADSCYHSMFEGCTGLTTAPQLPVTTLAGSCYAWMFSGCTGLTTAPQLPATTLEPWCYASMFEGCTSLTTPPVLLFSSVVNWSCAYMFRGCTSLATLPELPCTDFHPERAYTGNSHHYYQMFAGCANIKLSETQTGEYQTPYRIPSSGTGQTAPFSDSLKEMFSNTGGTFTGTPAMNRTYYTSNAVI